jgi:predicted amidohydrolase YtcJ
MPDGRAFHPEQAMTRMEALHAYTLANAWAAFDEERVGSIRPGKLADLVVLSRDILAIPEDEIPTARVVHTILGGRIVYSAGP